MVSSDRPAAVGQRIAERYQVEAVLGRGGMAAVYRVRDERTGKLLALKRGWANDARKAQRRGALLEREYHTLVQLAHPRIIEVYEYGVDAMGAYYTMELLEGADLSAGGRLPWRDACQLLYDVASSLAILHARGLIHRDVSFRNVRRTPEGRAKLIDFGAMAPIGVAKDVVGTPPFVAPEVIQLQELDGRADLFSLGALGYYLLTGRNAYPARRLSELRDVWRSKPTPPARMLAEVPEALSALIMQLLMLDRSARPRSAAEVMERLAALAGLALDERIEVSRAYLTTPALVGRDKQLVRARRQILSLARRDGSSLLIEGEAGAGRSRMLDACVLEGKLLGLTVVRADARDGSEGDWAVARALCTQLFELMPKESADAARLSRDVLSHVVEGFESDGSLSSTMPERSLLLRELRDFVLSLSRSQRLLLVVDDIDQIDEPSAALLAALAHKTERHALMLAMSLEHESARSGAASIRLLRLVAETIELPALQAEETHALMRSIFGDVAHLQLVSARIHALAQGSPRASMDLAQHLCERGLARYQAGSWLLPSQLDEADLPGTMADALRARLSRLGQDAMSLLEVLGLADGEALTLADYPELTRWSDHKRVFSALDELLSARLIVADGDGYRFSQRGFLSVLLQTIEDERRRALHARIADLLALRGGDVVGRARHLLLAGRERAAIELLCSVNLQAQLPPVSLLEQAIEHAERLAFSPRILHQLRTALLAKASLVLAPESFQRCLPPVLAQLERDSGLAFYAELSELPASERLQAALARTHARHLATPEQERVYPVLDAINELARLSGALCSYAAQLFDLESLERLPSLEPLEPLSPVLAVVGRIVEANKHRIAGRYMRHREICSEVLQRIAAADRGGLDEAQYRRTNAGLHYALGLFEASLGISAVETRAAVLEAEREHRVNAWRIRMLLHLNQGNVEEARKCERRAELLRLQENSQQSYLGMGAGFEVIALAELGDLVGVKSCVEQLNVLAQRYPAWRSWVSYAQSRYRWLQGDSEAALDALLPGLELTPATRHNVYMCLAGLHVRLLVELGRIEEALTQGNAYLELREREQLMGPDHGLDIGLAQARAASGAHDDALRGFDPIIAAAEQLGCEGFALGMLYETRARIAIRMDDQAAFGRFAELCAEEYRKANNPTLSARFARLLEDARQQPSHELEIPEQIRDLLRLTESETESAYNTVHSRILECVDDSDRARCALTMLLQSTESGSGFLYGICDGRCILLAGLPELPADEGLARWVDERLRAELETEDATITGDGDADQTRSDVQSRYVDADGRNIEAVFLFATRDQEVWLAAVLALHLPPGPRMLPPRVLLEELAHELIDHGDVDGVRADDPVTS